MRARECNLGLLFVALAAGACGPKSGGAADSGAPDTGPGVDSGSATEAGDGGCANPMPAWDANLARVDAPGQQGSQFSHVGFDAAGNAVVLWEQKDLTSSLVTIWAATRSSQGMWSAPGQLDKTMGSQTPPHSQLAVSAGGSAVAVWEEETNGSYTLPYAAVYDGSKGTWGAPTLLHADVAPMQATTGINPRIAILPSGDAIVAFAFDEGASFGMPDFTQQIYVNRYTGGMWSGPGRITTFDGSHAISGFPDVGMDQAGNAVVVAYQDDSDGTHALAARVAAGSTSPSAGPAPVDGTGTTTGKVPHVAVDPNGNATVVWTTGGAAYGTRIPAGSLQGTVTQLDMGTQSNASVAIVAVDANGNATAVWQEATNDPRAIWADRFAGGAWTGAVALETNDAGATNPALAVDDGGDVMVVWSAGAGIKASAFNVASGSWGSSVVLNPGPGTWDNPNVAFGHGCPRALAVWTQSDGAAGGNGAEIDSDFYH